MAAVGEKAERDLAVSVPADRELRLVAVTIRVFRAEDGADSQSGKAADALDGSTHAFFLGTELFLIAQVAERAAAALPEYGAVDGDAFRGRGEDLLQPAERVVLFRLDDADAEGVVAGGARHKHSASSGVPHTVPLRGISCNI